MSVDEYLDKLEFLVFHFIYMIFLYIVKIVRYIV
jgi:hypothetical protein